MRFGQVGLLVVPVCMLGCWLAPAAASAGEPKIFPVMIRVTADEHIRNTSHGKALVESVQNGFVRGGWEVIGANIEGPTSEVLEEAGFPVQQGAAGLGMACEAQVRVVVRANPGAGASRVALSAAETGTGRVLASFRGECKASGGKGKEARACDALVARLAARIRVRLGARPVAGWHHQIVFIAPPRKFDFKIHRELLKLATFRENTLSTRRLAVFHVHSSLDRDHMGEKVAEVIRRLVPRARFTVHKPATQYLVFAFDEHQASGDKPKQPK